MVIKLQAALRPRPIGLRDLTKQSLASTICGGPWTAEPREGATHVLGPRVVLIKPSRVIIGQRWADTSSTVVLLYETVLFNRYRQITADAASDGRDILARTCAPLPSKTCWAGSFQRRGPLGMR